MLDQSQITQWIASELLNRYTAIQVVGWGSKMLSYQEDFQKAGIDFSASSLEALPEFDDRRTAILLCESDEIPGMDLFRSGSLQVDRLAVIFKVMYNQTNLPDVSRYLAQFGFTRQMDASELIGNDWFIGVYHKTSGDTPAAIESYEQEFWRFMQIGAKRRLLHAEHHLERARLESEVQRQEILRQQQEILRQQTEKDWETRWDAFLNSRSGRMLQWFAKIRNKLLPRGGRLERALGSLTLFALSVRRAVQREGLWRFIAALPRRVWKRIQWTAARLRLRYSRSQASRKIDIEAVTPRPACPVHSEEVEVIVCVHNALADVQRCLQSVEASATGPYRMILVDDGSGDETRQFLEGYAAGHGSMLLRSDKATGYTLAANRGLRASSALFVVLLNSDTIVTPGWLDKMVCCAKTNPKFAIVGPLSNTASWQSIPKVEEGGDWAQNDLPVGMSVNEMGQLVAQFSGRLYPEMPLLNGFCLLIRRELIQAIGIFDEEAFGPGYGEEDDYALRARKAGWSLGLADDAYVFHAQSKSYSSEKRRKLSQRAVQVLTEKHGAEIIQAGVEFCHKSRVMEGIRARAQVTQERQQALQQGAVFAGKRILFLLPVTSPGGGANVIRTEALAMQKMGVEVEFFNLRENRPRFEAAYPNLQIPVQYGDVEDIQYLAQSYAAVVASYNPSVAWMSPISLMQGSLVRAYYIQGFEPLMYDPGSPDYRVALESYSLLPDLVRFTKTDWTERMVFQNTGKHSHVIGVSLDIDLYRPRPNNELDNPQRPVRIAAMVRPEAPYREPAKTMQLLSDITREFGGRVEVCLFGTRQDNPAFLALPHQFPWTLYGVLSQEKVAALLSQTDIFIDYSSHQAMGLTALEAMACGNAVIVPEYGGAVSFARHEQNSLVVDTAAYENVYQALKRLVQDETLRKNIQRHAIYEACSFYPERAALNILNVLFEQS